MVGVSTGGEASFLRETEGPGRIRRQKADEEEVRKSVFVDHHVVESWQTLLETVGFKGVVPPPADVFFGTTERDLVSRDHTQRSMKKMAE